MRHIWHYIIHSFRKITVEVMGSSMSLMMSGDTIELCEKPNVCSIICFKLSETIQPNATKTKTPKTQTWKYSQTCNITILSFGNIKTQCAQGPVPPWIESKLAEANITQSPIHSNIPVYVTWHTMSLLQWLGHCKTALLIGMRYI